MSDTLRFRVRCILRLSGDICLSVSLLLLNPLHFLLQTILIDGARKRKLLFLLPAHEFILLLMQKQLDTDG